MLCLRLRTASGGELMWVLTRNTCLRNHRPILLFIEYGYTCRVVFRVRFVLISPAPASQPVSRLWLRQVKGSGEIVTRVLFGFVRVRPSEHKRASECSRGDLAAQLHLLQFLLNTHACLCAYIHLYIHTCWHDHVRTHLHTYIYTDTQCVCLSPKN